MSKQIVVLCVILALGGMTGFAAKSWDAFDEPLRLAEETVFADIVNWQMLTQDFDWVVLTVSGPEGYYFRTSFEADEDPYFESVDDEGSLLPDGFYNYQLTVNFEPEAIREAEPESDPSSTRQRPVSREQQRPVTRGLQTLDPVNQIGQFSIRDGSLMSNEPNSPDVVSQYARSNDPGPGFAFYTYPGNLTVAGNIGIGTEGPSQEVDIVAQSPGIQLSDPDDGLGWFIMGDEDGFDLFHDSASDADRVFHLDGSAPKPSIWIDSSGDLGLGTSNPVVAIHAVDGDSPTLRLEQDGSSGFTPQTWDVVGNETNFYVRDATNGSTLPFRIQPGAKSSSIVIDAQSEVGIGLNNPDASLHVKRTDGTAKILVEEASGTTAARFLFQLINNGGSRFSLKNSSTNKEWFFSMDGNQDFSTSFIGTGGAELLIKRDGRVQMGPGPNTVFDLSPTGNLVIGGALTEFSDRNGKKNIQSVDGQQVLERLAQLPLSEWTYKTDEDGVRHLGPMAQDFQAAFGLGQDEKHLATMDTSGVALAAIKGLYQVVQAKEVLLQDQREEIETLKAELVEIRQMLSQR